MPRISAPTVREHHDRQRAVILDAVGDLLVEHGYAGLDLAAIARRVGLARTSLYRYGKHKDELVAQWLERSFEPAQAESEDALAQPGTPAERLAAWLDVQLNLAVQPRHGAAVRLMAEFDGLPESVRQSVRAGHQRLNAAIVDTIAEALEGQPGRDAAIVTALVHGITAAAANQAMTGLTPALRTEARHALLAVLERRTTRSRSSS